LKIVAWWHPLPLGSHSRLGVIGTVLYFVFSLGAGIFLAEHAIRPEREPINPINSEPLWNFARGIRATMSDAEIERPGNVTLRGWGIRPANANSGSVLLLHGLSENRTAMSGVAEFLLAAGYSVLMPDARAHGESGGDVATYGLLEAGDIRAWVDWIRNNQHPECVFALGESMGAAELLESLAEETRFCAVAAESAFANFREAAYDHVSQPFYTQPWLGRSVFRPIVEFGLLYSRVRYGLDLTGLSPEEIVAKTKTPILLIHGTDDSLIPLRHSLRIAAANLGVEVWEVINAGHCEAFRMWRADFERRLLSWFSSHAADTGSAHEQRLASPGAQLSQQGIYARCWRYSVSINSLSSAASVGLENSMRQPGSVSGTTHKPIPTKARLRGWNTTRFELLL
jgi:fermentation-respiration switch protein FrsA (DUF1100 family)